MARKAMKIKQQKKQKFSTREYSRCRICGRPHAYLRKHGNSVRKALERLPEPGNGIQDLRQLRQACSVHSLSGGPVLGF